MCQEKQMRNQEDDFFSSLSSKSLASCVFFNPLGKRNLNFYGKYLFRIIQMHTVCVASNHNKLKDRGKVWRGNTPHFLFQTFSIPIWTTNLPVTLKFFKALSDFVKDKKGRALPPLKLYCLYHSKKKKSSPKDFFFFFATEQHNKRVSVFVVKNKTGR